MTVQVGIVGIGTYFPDGVETASDLVDRTDIPLEILQTKMGIIQRHIAGEKDTVSMMASEAGKKAIAQAGVSPESINMVISHGSEYKDHLVWNAAGKIQENVGAVNAFGFEMYALCAGAPIAMNMARGMMLGDDSLNTVLLAAGSRENDLINLKNPRSRFMFNFGAGGGAMVLQKNATKNLIMGASAITDGKLSETVVLTEEAIPSGADEVVGDLFGRLDVTDPQLMADRLGASSLENFVKVITQAVEKSNASLSDVKFLGITHMKRSFYETILESIGLTPEQSVYLDHYGHVQSVDQALAIELGVQQGKIKDGDLIVLAGAGTGYTWSAVAVRWG